MNEVKEQPSGSSLKIKEKKEKLGGEGKEHFEGLQAKKLRNDDEKIDKRKKLLSWADQHSQLQQKEERKKERRGRSVKSPKSANFVKKNERLASEDKIEKLSGKSEERSASEDDLTKELLSLISPPPRIHIPESLDPSKVKLFGRSTSTTVNNRSLEQDQLGRGEDLAAKETKRDSSDMKGNAVISFSHIYTTNPTLQMGRSDELAAASGLASS